MMQKEIPEAANKEVKIINKCKRFPEINSQSVLLIFLIGKSTNVFQVDFSLKNFIIYCLLRKYWKINILILVKIKIEIEMGHQSFSSVF